MIGYVDKDLHGLNLPYHEGYTKENWKATAKYETTHNINTKRFFLATGEKEGDLDSFLFPFHRKKTGRFDLFKLGGDIDEIEWRLEKYWERGITTVICIASGIKENRFRHTIWHRRNNVNETTTDCKRFMDHEGTIQAYRKVLRLLWKRWKAKPIIFEFINEPEAFSTSTKRSWYFRMLHFCRDILGIPMNRIAFEKWDSSKILDVLDTFNCWMFEHGVNHINWFKRFHRGEMQKIYETYDWIAADSDGAKKAEGNISLLGEGLKGLTWNDDFTRPAPKHMKDGLIYDYKHGGKGWIIMSAGAYYKHPNGDKPCFSDWKHVALEGLTKAECREQNVNWNLFSYWKLFKRKPLGELKAIRKATNKLF